MNEPDSTQLLPVLEWHDPRVHLLDDTWLDRKSTRLNSSHGYISYAVFCLKKKKKHNVRRGRVECWDDGGGQAIPSLVLQRLGWQQVAISRGSGTVGRLSYR